MNATGFRVTLASDQRRADITVSGDIPHIEAGDTSLLLFGHCLAGAAEIARGLAAAVALDDPAPLMGWPGAYACVLVRPGEVVAFTDLAGQFPLYHSWHLGEFAVASDPVVLADLHHRPADAVTAAARIACSAVLPLWEERSAFRDIARLPGGAVLRATPDRVRLSRLESRDDQGGSEALRHALTQAVAVRCAAGPISADFSGGLDSTSLAFLAARHTTVEAVVYHHPRLPAADLAEAVGFARHDRRIRLTEVHGTQATLPYASLAEPGPRPRTAEPARGSLAVRRALLRLERAVPHGMHLTGEGGDAVLGAAPSYLGGLARPARIGGLVRHCTSQAALRHTSALGLAVRAGRLARTTPARALTHLGARLLRPDSGELTWPEAVTWWPIDGGVLGWLTARTRRDLAERVADPALAAHLDAGPARVATLTELRQSADAQRQLRELGEAAGCGCTLLSSTTRWCAPASRSRPTRASIQARASRCWPPRCATWCPRGLPAAHQGDYSAEEYHGARAVAARLHRLVDDSLLAEMGVVEPAPVRACLDRLLAGAPVPLGAMGQFVATELWLRDLDGGA
ncbi:asparagine synthase-related protein [Nonomuraea sp. NBC_01738]|nr:asparagine synthase-related protein [Nonomuraea sp. NBC_01738]